MDPGMEPGMGGVPRPADPDVKPDKPPPPADKPPPLPDKPPPPRIDTGGK